jgi:hypothetical protein
MLVWEQIAEKNTGTSETGSEGMLEKQRYNELHDLHFSLDFARMFKSR